MKKYKKKVTKFGKLFVSLSILLGAFFGLQSDIYASAYKTGTSDHYSINVSQLATGREEIVVSWHNVYEGNYITYIDLVSLRCTGSNGNNYTFYLCLHDTGEITIKFPNTDLNNIAVSTVQSWEFTDIDSSSLSSISLYTSQINLNLSQIETNQDSIIAQVQLIASNISSFQSSFQDYISWIKNYANFRDMDIYSFLAYKYFINNGSSVSWSNYLKVGTSNLGKFATVYDYTNPVTYSNGSYTFFGDTILIFASSNVSPLSFSRLYSQFDGVSMEHRQVYSESLRLHAFIIRNPDKNPNGKYYFDIAFSGSVNNDVLENTLDNSYILPMYLGPLNNCPYLEMFGLHSSQVDDLNNNISDIQSASDQTSTIEQQINSDFNNNLDNIDTTSDLITDNNLLNSASWVRARFNELTVNNPFGDVLTFSMLLGLALLLIGRIL